MISKKRFNKNSKECYCQTPELIENYEQAINDKTQIWDCHHRDEIRTLPSGMVVIRTKEELIENGRYYNCPPNELIFMTPSDHMRLHIGILARTEKLRKRVSEEKRGVTLSEFGKKFQEHFGITYTDDIKLYKHHHRFYEYHGYYEWELKK